MTTTVVSLNSLRQRSVPDLISFAIKLGIETPPRKRQDILFAILKKEAQEGNFIEGDGVLKLCQMAMVF